jgi:molecular chaperone GrpE
VNKDELRKETEKLNEKLVTKEMQEMPKEKTLEEEILKKVAVEEKKLEGKKPDEKKLDEKKPDEKKPDEKKPEVNKVLKQPAKKNVRKKVDKSKERIDELEDRLKRQLAEFENFRKRTELEKTARFNMGAKSVLERVLPVVDNFERGLQGVSENTEENSFVDGMNKVYKQLIAELETIGVEPILSIGEEFDPEVHNAVMQVESDEYEAGIVAQELLKGYKYKGIVVRHSMVGVVA